MMVSVKSKEISTGTIRTHDSIANASRITGVIRSNIKSCLIKKQQSDRGFQFARLEEEFAEYIEKKENQISSKSPKSKPIKLKNLVTSEIVFFNSIARASKVLSINRGNMVEFLSGKRQNVGIYQIAYQSDNFKEYISKTIIKILASKKTPIIAEKNGITLQYNSQHECARELGINVCNINRCLKNIGKSNGYSFKYSMIN
jgi:hypothetical protein